MDVRMLLGSQLSMIIDDNVLAITINFAGVAGCDKD